MLALVVVAFSIGLQGAEALAPAVRPLDARVNSSKITSAAQPSLPGVIAPALPVVHRIADEASAVPMDAALFASARDGLTKGAAFLGAAQGARGGWMEGSAVAGTDQEKRSLAASSAVTALGVRALVQIGVPMDGESLTRATAWVRQRTMVDGTFQPDAGGGLGNYVAACVASGWAALGDVSQPDAVALRSAAIDWLKGNQWDQSEGVQPTQDWFGGSGYGKHGRPDLSNTQMMLDALHDAGVSPEDPHVQRALVFVTRTQNFKATNDAAWAQSGSDDGGFVYTPANGGESFASDAAGEGRYGEIVSAGAPRSLRSYGSMTYAGFKSMLFAGLTPDDPRVRAAWGWIANHWTFDENPGMGQQGKFYYLHAVARALAASRQATITDARGQAHNWRDELVTTLLALQQPDGSWVNSADRWEESNADLVTIYAMLALEEALKPSPAPPSAASGASPTPR